MPRKKKEAEDVQEVTKVVQSLVPIAELLKNESTVLGERHDSNLPARAEFSPVFLEIATRLVAAGLTENDLAYVIGCTVARIKYWKRHNPLFKKACTSGKGLAKSHLIAAGIRAATGYETVEKNYKIKRKVLEDGTIIEYAAEESHFHKHMKPDASMLVFMLANMSRQAKDEIPWTSQHKIEVDSKKTLSIKISGKVASDQIDRLAGAFLPTEIIEAEFEHAGDEDNTKKSRSLLSGNTKDDTREPPVS